MEKFCVSTSKESHRGGVDIYTLLRYVTVSRQMRHGKTFQAEGGITKTELNRETMKYVGVGLQVLGPSGAGFPGRVQGRLSRGSQAPALGALAATRPASWCRRREDGSQRKARRVWGGVGGRGRDGPEESQHQRSWSTESSRGGGSRGTGCGETEQRPDRRDREKALGSRSPQFENRWNEGEGEGPDSSEQRVRCRRRKAQTCPK